MKLILPFFCIFISIIAFLIFLILFLVIRINIKEIKISNVENGIKKDKLEKTYDAFIELLLFGKIKIAKINLNEKTLKNINLKEKLENVKNDAKDIKNDFEVVKKIRSLEIIKRLKMTVEKFKLHGEIGTENAMLTAFLVASISSIFRYIIKKCRL